MAGSPKDRIDFAFIVDKLEELASRTKNSQHGLNFERLTLNHRVLANIQINMSIRENFIQNSSSSELLMHKRGTVFSWSSIKSSIDFFRWSRSATAEELSIQSYNNAKENSLILSIMALRSLLEICGNAALLEKDLQELPEPKDENFARKDWFNAIQSLIDSRLEGVRVDYDKITKSGLRGAGRFSYKPGHLEADKTAKDLLKGIDLLDKRIKGTRNAYEFFSEFSHPNLASVLTNYDRVESKLQVIDIHGYATHHQKRHVGAMFLDNFGHLLVEGIEVVEECVDELLRIDLFLKLKGETISIHAKKVIRRIVRKNTSSFESWEACPCNSGINIQRCCGNMIKASKFGRRSAAAQLH
jgi:hypothetical protein